MRKILLGSLVALAGCASVPTGPNVMVLPGSGKSFDQFRFDDFECRQYAHAQVGGTDANQAAVNSGVASAAVGTAVGTVAGAAAQSGATAQHRYDMGYQQCMYAKGHKIPMAASRYDRRPAYREATPPPPPPPGTPPPPPRS